MGFLIGIMAGALAAVPFAVAQRFRTMPAGIVAVIVSFGILHGAALLTWLQWRAELAPFAAGTALSLIAGVLVACLRKP